MQVKKKTAIIAVVALLVCVAVYLNWSYQSGLESADVSGGNIVSDAERLAARNNNDSAAPASPNFDAYFAQIRLTRQKARDEAISLLQDTIGNDTADLSSRDRAVATMATIASSSRRVAARLLTRADATARSTTIHGAPNRRTPVLG